MWDGMKEGPLLPSVTNGIFVIKEKPFKRKYLKKS
jgi:hypothetical protein